jgi:antitoxin component YwqK of YwqJK toxin-antitoxin module
MSYEATVEFKFNSKHTAEYRTSYNPMIPDYIPEQHFTLTAPTADWNTTQMFKLFEKFMLMMGYAPQSIMSGAMSLVFNEWMDEEEQRKVCNEYDLTMNEDLDKKFKEMKNLEEAIEQANANLGTGK